MAVITLYNFNKLVSLIEISRLNFSLANIFKKPLSDFHDNELKKIALAIAILENPGRLVEYKICMKKKDTFTYVFERESPSYHYGKYCDYLYKSYKNYKITDPATNASFSSDIVNEIRKIVKNNVDLKDDIEFLKKEIKAKLNIDVDLQLITPVSSGTISLSNISLSDIEQQIENILAEAENYFSTAGPVQQLIIRKYKKATPIAYTNKDLYNNDTGYSQKAIKNFLKKYDMKFKQSIKDRLIEFFILKYNPELKFPGNLLEHFGFKACKKCHVGMEYFVLMNANKRSNDKA